MTDAVSVSMLPDIREKRARSAGRRKVAVLAVGRLLIRPSVNLMYPSLWEGYGSDVPSSGRAMVPCSCSSAAAAAAGVPSVPPSVPDKDAVYTGKGRVR